MKDYLKILFFTFLGAALIGCAVTSKFDQNTYEGALTLKIDSIKLLSKATAPGVEYAQEIAALKVRLSSQLAYEKGKGKPNFISFKQWDILLSTNNDLLGRFIEDWESGKKFKPAYVVEKCKQIEAAFDEILRLEGAKPK